MKEETKQFLQKVFDESKSEVVVFQGDCHDCQKEVDVEVKMDREGKVEVMGGAIYPVTSINGTLTVYFKCDECFDKKRRLTDYQECEVFSRVVGFLRPINSWNKGKRAEENQRKMFDLGGFIKEK